MENKNLYFIAIIPPEVVCNKVRAVQQDLSDRFLTLKSLKVVPHITLKAPFEFSFREHENVVAWFDNLKMTTKSFMLTLHGFESFSNRNQPVIYIKPDQNTSLASLQKEVLDQFRISFPAKPVMNLETTFAPHLTVAYRDLKPEAFSKAWEEYRDKEFSASFLAGQIHLLQHDRIRWNVIRSNTLADEF